MLPKIDVPIYELMLPSTEKPIMVRPFVVKEEKLLLTALASGDENQIIETTKQVVNNCILTEGIDVEKLPFFDVDYLFIAMRAKSVGESIDVNFICNKVLEDETKCNFVFPTPIDISKIEVVNKDISRTVVLNDRISVKMKYPSYEIMKRMVDRDDDITRKVKVIAASIEMVVDGDTIHSPKDYSKEEFEEFIEGFTEEMFAKLEHFVDNFPHFRIVAENDCPKCGFHHHIVYKDFSSFFA